jgi:hypothetical protein
MKFFHFTNLALVGAAYLVLIIPFLINGGPIYWGYDSFAYLHGGSTGLEIATSLETRYTHMEKLVPSSAPLAQESVQVQAQSSAIEQMPPLEEDRISSARSPYYATFLAGISSLFGPSAPVHFFALLFAATFVMFLRTVFPGKLPSAAILVFAGLALSMAGFFSAVLLPDILAPMGLLASAILFAYWPKMSWAERIVWFAILVFSLISHSTHLAVAILILPLAMLLAGQMKAHSIWPPTIIVTAAIGVGILGSIMFAMVVERNYGYKPTSFPMIAASIITDGPGRDFLKESCPQSGYVYCDYLYSKASEVDQYLWSLDPEIGVYLLVDRETQDRMSAEQWRFLLDTLRADFWGQFQASFIRAMRQITDNSVNQFAYGQDIQRDLNTLPDWDRNVAANTAFAQKRFPLNITSHASQLIGWISLAGLVLTLVFRSQGTYQSREDIEKLSAFSVLCIIVIIGFVVNAGLTGVASQPQGRYSARIFLLFPILFGACLALLLKQTRTPKIEEG